MLAFERPLSTASPERQGVFGVVGFEHGRQAQERTVERGAIVAGQLDKASLLNEAAQFDQMAGALAPSHHPCPRVDAGSARFQAMSRGIGPALGVIGRRQR